MLNKADLLGWGRRGAERPGAVAVSAITGEGLPALKSVIDAADRRGMETRDYDIPARTGSACLAVPAWRGGVTGTTPMLRCM